MTALELRLEAAQKLLEIAERQYKRTIHAKDTPTVVDEYYALLIEAQLERDLLELELKESQELT